MGDFLQKFQKFVAFRRKPLPPSSWQKTQDLMAEANSHMK
jgi:hypothetical protein